MEEKNVSRQTGMAPRRLESLSDAIFAIAMTLLVLSINLPESGGINDVPEFLWSQAHNFWNLFLSFLLLSFFWLIFSQQFHHISKTNSTVLLISIFTLFFVVLVPFSTSLMNDSSNDVIAEVFFSSNLFILTCLLALNWTYATRKSMLAAEGKEKHIERVSKNIWMLPAVPLAGIFLALIVPGWSKLVYLLIPLMLVLPQKNKENNGE